jgi:RimJ/RimL family protein N-acetyltransferase
MICGDEIRFRAPEREDIPRFVEWLNKPKVLTGLTIYLPISRETEGNWFDNMLKAPLEEHPFVIEVQIKNDWEMIGNIGFNSLNYRVRSAEVGIFIGETKYWDCGYGTKAMNLMLRHGFKTLNLNRIMLRVFSDNPRAIHVYEKCGFVHEGILRQAVFSNGSYKDEILMSILFDEWLSKST